MEQLQLKILSPDGILFDDAIHQVEFKTPNGYIGILKNHIPMVSVVIPSLIYIKDNKGHRQSGLINKGIVKVDKDKVIILTDFFKFSNEVNASSLEQYSKKMIEKANKRKPHDQAVYDKVIAQIEKETDKLKQLIKK